MNEVLTPAEGQVLSMPDYFTNITSTIITVFP